MDERHETIDGKDVGRTCKSFGSLSCTFLTERVLSESHVSREASTCPCM